MSYTSTYRQKLALSSKALLIITLFNFFPILNFAQNRTSPQRLLIKTGEGVMARSNIQDALKGRNLIWEKGNAQQTYGLWSLEKSNLSMDRVIATLREEHPTWQIEPDYTYRLVDQPDDPLYPQQANLMPVGPDCLAGVDAQTAWETYTGDAQSVIVIIDGGMDLNHEDLKANLWKNPGETGLDSLGQDKATNGIDDDENGYVDDVNGWDFANDDSEPQDDNGHGTHVAGIIGARADNGLGISGICWNTKLLPLKFTDAQGYGSTSDAIRAIDYAIDMKRRGANILVINNSWGGGDNSVFLEEAIERANKAEILFVAAAGNDGLDNERYPFYPASYDLDNIISVGALDCEASLASFSNYGDVSVDIAAPGDAIMSTLPGDTYGVLSGTSMAAPHVSGGLGLLQGIGEDYSHLELKDAILNSAFPQAELNGKILSGGSLHLSNAVSFSPDLWGSQYVFGSRITALVTYDSILWVGTNGGLLRLDMTNNTRSHYTNANSGLPNNYITCLVTDSEGNLWVGTKDGLANFNKEGWQQFSPERPRLPELHITAITLQGDSVLWTGTRKGWVNRYHITNDRWDVPRELDSSGIKSIHIATTPNGQDALYLASGQKLVVKSLLNKGNRVLFEAPILQVRQDAKRLWIATQNQGGFQIRSINLETGNTLAHNYLNRILNDSLPTGSISQMAITEEGVCWLGNKFGHIVRYDFAERDIQLFKRPAQKTANTITAMWTPNEDSVWIGNIKGEAALFNGEEWEIIDLPISNLPRGKIRALTTSADSVLMGTGNGLMRYREGIFNVLGIREGREVVNSLEIDEDGDIWMGTPKGLITNYSGSWQTITSDSSDLPNNHIKSVITEDSKVWIGTYGGLVSFEKTTQQWQTYPSCCTSDSILYLKNGRNGNLWIGTTKGLSLYQNGIFESNITQDVLGNHSVLSIEMDTIKQRLWVGTNKGLLKLNQLPGGQRRFEQYTLANSGIPDNQIKSVVVDRLHRVWVGTQKGIARYDGRRWENYNTTNSVLPNDQVLSLAATKDEGIWAGTASGLGIIIPEDLVAFNMDDQVVCLGDQLLFENLGINGDSLQWKINDSLVSVADTFSYAFQTPGAYKISLTISIDTVSFTDSGFVSVKAPLEIALPSDTVSLAPSISIHPGQFEDASFLWSNKQGDTLSQEAVFSIYESGTYFLQAEDACGYSQADSIMASMLGDGEYVLPGDALPDGNINLSDWLLLSLLDGQTGTSRSDTVDVWEAEFSTDWTLDLQADITQKVKDSVVNYKHADVDGNGVVDLQADGNALENYASQTSPSVHMSSPTDSSGINLVMEVLNKQAYADPVKQALVFDFYLEGDSSLLQDVHGLAFRLQLGTPADSAWTYVYDTLQAHKNIRRNRATYSDMGFVGQPVWETPDTLQPNFRKGRVGGGGVIIVIENIDTNRVSLSNFQVDLNLSLSNILILDDQGNFLPVNEISAQKVQTVNLNLDPTADFVDITSFQAQCDSGQTQISWSAWEQNVSAYVLERFISSNFSYEVVDSISASSIITQNPKMYTMSVQQDSAAWYRLRAISTTQEVAYTDSIFGRACVPITQGNAQRVGSIATRIYPNPSKGSLWIEQSFSTNENAKLELYSLEGKRVFTHTYAVGPTINRTSLNISALPPGLYFIRILVNHQIITHEKIILRR